MRLYFRVNIYWLVLARDRNKKSLLCKLPSFINAATISLVPLVVSSCAGLQVFCCNTVALLETKLPSATSDTLRLTRSESRSLLSKVILDRARSRLLPSSSSRIWFLQIWDIWTGLFWPTILPMFHDEVFILKSTVIWEIRVWLSLMSERWTYRTNFITYELNISSRGTSIVVWDSQALACW